MHRVCSIFTQNIIIIIFDNILSNIDNLLSIFDIILININLFQSHLDLTIKNYKNSFIVVKIS